MKESIQITLLIWVSLIGVAFYFFSVILNVSGGLLVRAGQNVERASDYLIDKSFEVGGF